MTDNSFSEELFSSSSSESSIDSSENVLRRSVKRRQLFLNSNTKIENAETLSKDNSDFSDSDFPLTNKKNSYADTSDNEIKKKCRCVSCSREVEDVLYLKCEHFLCLVCGSEQLNKKYEKYLKDCLVEEHIETGEPYNVNECFNDYKDKRKRKKRDIKRELYKREILATIHCCVCDIKSDLSIDAIEMLTRVGLISEDVLNVHRIYYPLCKKNLNNDEISSFPVVDDRNNELSDINNTLDSDYLKNVNLNKLKIPKEKYDYLNEQTDNLHNYSYICNICSHNEAILYCRDCVEYLCQPCFDNIHELDVFKKLKIKSDNVHDFYPIDKSGVNLKKLVKAPRKCLNLSDDEFHKNLESLEDDGYSEEKPFETYSDTDPRHGHKIQDKDSDFDMYDEDHYKERITRLIEKKNDNKKKEIISEKLNELVEEMKNGSEYESTNSSCRGSLGSTINQTIKRKGERTKHTVKKKSNLRKKITTDDDFCSYHSGNSELISSCDDDEHDYINKHKNKEVFIKNVRDIINKDDDKLTQVSSGVVNNADFTTIQNIRCPEHFGYPIQYYCHTCCNKCFCSECAINGTHNAECDIEHISTAFITILNKYLIKWNEIISDLINDLHRNFYESLKDIQTEWSALLSECFCELNSEVNYVINTLIKKEVEVINVLNAYLQNFKKENLEYEQLLKEKQKQIDEIINIIRNNKHQTDPVNIIKFYRENINNISKVMLMNQDITVIENLTKVRESKIFYMDFYTSQMTTYLKHLQATTKTDESI